MLTISRRPYALAALLLLALLAVPAPGAQAAPGGSCPPTEPDCHVWDDQKPPPRPGDGGGGRPGDGGGGGGKPAPCVRDGEPVKCYDEVLGWFNNGDGCYYKLQDPQPEKVTEGMKWYTRSCNGQIDAVELETAPDGFGAPPNPQELAWRAYAKITLAAPPISVAPRPSAGPGLVGLPIWLWADSDSRWWRLSASDTERGLTVSITAEVTRVVWDLGNGDQVTCPPGGGTAYDPARDAGRKPECGLPQGFQRPGDYDIRATTHWTVRWSSSSGAGGELPPQVRTSDPVPIRIDELQVVTQ